MLPSFSQPLSLFVFALPFAIFQSSLLHCIIDFISSGSPGSSFSSSYRAPVGNFLYLSIFICFSNVFLPYQPVSCIQLNMPSPTPILVLSSLFLILSLLVTKQHFSQYFISTAVILLSFFLFIIQFSKLYVIMVLTIVL